LTRHGVTSIVNQGCIDYTNLTASNVRAQTGTWSTSGVVTLSGNAIVDNGPNNYVTTRHTVHTVPEYDPITQGGLRTIPDCALASVRLGNVSVGAQWEGLEYTITVDQTYALLIVQYATVLEAPGHDGPTNPPAPPGTYLPNLGLQDPKITLEILNANGQIIHQQCGNIELSSYVGMQAHHYGTDPTWNLVPRNTVQMPNGGLNSSPIYWKDWTTIGVNLRYPVDLRGQNVRVRIRNFDCSPTAHFGYSYFTLDCARAGLDGLSCGDNTINVIEAPEGFTYCWYKKFNPNGTLATEPFNCVSTNRSFSPPTNDTATYICKVTSIAAPNCSFNLTAVLKPRWPASAANFTQTPMNCQNVIQLINQSYMTEGGTPRPNEKPETFYWLVTDLSGDTVLNHTAQIPPESSIAPNPPTFVAPNDGATYNLRLVTGVSEDECQDTLIRTLIIPPITIPSLDTVDIRICNIQLPYTFNGKTYYGAGVYNDTLVGVPNGIGCDSVRFINLIVQNEVSSSVDSIICFNTSIIWNGILCNATGDYVYTTTNSVGCDSIVTLHLVVRDKLVGAISETICFGDSRIWGGEERTTTGSYEAVFTNLATGCDSTVTLHLTVRDRIFVEVDSTICAGQRVMWGGVEYGIAGSYQKTEITANGCDSVVQLNLRVNPVMDIRITNIPDDICADDTEFAISYENRGGSAPTRYILTFTPEARNMGFVDTEIVSNGTQEVVIQIPENVRPDIYGVNIQFLDDTYGCVGTNRDPIFKILYPSWIVQQKWNNVLAVLNNFYNGGYTFSDYIWYRNGAPIPGGGTDLSYLYIGETSFDFVSNYQVSLTRIDDGTTLLTCPIIPEYRQDNQQFPTMVTGDRTIQIRTKGKGTITFMSVSGILMSKQSFSAGESSIQTPAQQGFYIMVVEEEGQMPVKQVFVVK